MYRFLTKDGMERIHDRSVYLLEKVGVHVSHKNTLKRLEEAGAQVNHEIGYARFPEDLVEECIALAPKKFTLAARNPEYDLSFPLPENEFYARSNTGAFDYVVPRSDEYRPISLADLKDWIRLCDALKNIDFCATPFPLDTPPNTSDLYAMKNSLENTEKHLVIQPYSAESMPYIADMAVTAAGGKAELKKRPIASIFLGTVSPLSFKPMDVEGLGLAGEYGMPVQIYSLPTMGGTAPMTMAGIVLLSNVENLAGNVITQVLNPGTPMIFLGHKISIDMATGNTLQSTVENFIAAGAHAEFVKERYGIPFHTWGSGSDSWLPDGQSMIERSFLGLLTSIGGTDVLGGLGQLGCDCSISPAQLVVDDDIVGMIRKIRRGIQVDNESLAWEVIEEVGPGGQFLDHDHTLQHCRESLFPTTFNRKSKAEWLSQGQKDIVDNANDIVDQLKESHEVPPLPAEVSGELSRIVKRADEKLI